MTLFVRHSVVASLALVAGWAFAPWAAAQAPPDPVPDAGIEVLAQGPVHEAFAQPVTFNAEPGRIVKKAPPAPVEEMPAEQRPAGDDVQWIPGYWAWDEGRDDFIWVSGFWRVMPPGLVWVPGYWAETEGGHQWVSGFWTPANTTEVQYLPQPPQSLEAGATTPAPSPNHFWVPGNWYWNDTRYVWQPGFWSVNNPNWAWNPAYYAWSPRGYIYVHGFWDYLAPQRGLLFAPVYFNPGYNFQGGYMPRYAVSLPQMLNYLFVNPYRRSYFFGNYYANSYTQFGYQPWFAFHQSRFGYDPIYAYYRQKQGSDWDNRIRRDYATLRDNEAGRPSATFAAQSAPRVAGQPVQLLVQPLDRLTSSSEMKLERVAREQRDQISRTSNQLRDFAKLRSQGELRADVTAAAAAKTGGGKMRLDLPAGITARANANVRTTLRPNIDVDPRAPGKNPSDVRDPRGPLDPRGPGRNPVDVRDPREPKAPVLDPKGPLDPRDPGDRVNPPRDPKVKLPGVNRDNPPSLPGIDPDRPRVDRLPPAPGELPPMETPEPKAPRVKPNREPKEPKVDLEPRPLPKVAPEPRPQPKVAPAPLPAPKPAPAPRPQPKIVPPSAPVEAPRPPAKRADDNPGRGDGGKGSGDGKGKGKGKGGD